LRTATTKAAEEAQLKAGEVDKGCASADKKM
jgi:hypothetical protein